mgnify:CR=1 FL=1
MQRDEYNDQEETLLRKEFGHCHQSNPDIDNNDGECSCSCCYRPVILGRRKRILLCLSLDSYYWAVYRLLSEVVTVCSFGFASTNHHPIGNLSLLGSYLLFCCVAAPLWQHFAILPIDSGSSSNTSTSGSGGERHTEKEVGCEHGCMAAMACVHLAGVCTCQNLLVVRRDLHPPPPPDTAGEDGWWTDSVATDRLDTFSYSRTNTVSSVNTSTSAAATASQAGPSVSRYIPFSVYNLLYIITHEGQQELNPSLPYDHMPAFGMGRSLLLCFGTSLRASLSLALVYNAYYAMLVNEDEHLFYTTVSLIALGSALTDLDVYFVAIFFGTMLYPYTLVVWFALYFPMCSWVLNPRQGTFLFWVLKKYWKTVVGCASVDMKKRERKSGMPGAGAADNGEAMRKTDTT